MELLSLIDHLRKLLSTAQPAICNHQSRNHAIVMIDQVKILF